MPNSSGAYSNFPGAIDVSDSNQVNKKLAIKDMERNRETVKQIKDEEDKQEDSEEDESEEKKVEEIDKEVHKYQTKRQRTSGAANLDGNFKFY